MRVLLVSHYYPAHGGGVEAVAGQIAARLAGSARWNVVWIASDCNTPPRIDGCECRPAPAWNGIERSAGLPYPLWSPSMLAQLWREVGAADVVHVHDYLYAGNLTALLFARLQGKPVLLTQHIGFVPYDSVFLRACLSTLNWSLGRWALQRAGRVVFVSNAVRAYFDRIINFQRTPVVIANGVDLDRFFPVSAENRQFLKERFGVASNRPLLLFVGRFVEKKGLAVVRSLAERMPNHQWCLAGEGPVDPAGWGLPNVRVLGKLPQGDLADVYRAADLLVLPSKGEGFPLVVQEAMACGTPAVVGLDSAAAFPVGDDRLPAESVEGADAVLRWERRLASLLADAEDLAALRERVAEFARGNWSWNSCGEAYRSEILGIVGPAKA
jgi:glycosyltransferase involved in cell wall biosynthesis